MKGPASFGHLLTATIALSTTASAWPNWLPDMDSMIVRRDTTASLTTKTSATETGSATGTKATSSIKTTNLNTGGITQTDSTASATGTATDDSSSGNTATSNSTQTTHATYDAEDAAGGISMITPATTTGTALYRIGETVTWVWNYTSVQGTPTAVDVLVSCSAATETWTLTQNMSYEATGTYTWDTNAYAETAVQSPLLTEEYTLIIYDADSSISATAEPGYLSVYSGFTFGMYTNRPYKDLSDWKCVTCSAANSDLDRKALRFVFGMAVITVLSFTWFVAGFGVLM